MTPMRILALSVIIVPIAVYLVIRFIFPSTPDPAPLVGPSAITLIAGSGDIPEPADIEQCLAGQPIMGQCTYELDGVRPDPDTFDIPTAWAVLSSSERPVLIVSHCRSASQLVQATAAGSGESYFNEIEQPPGERCVLATYIDARAESVECSVDEATRPTAPP